MHRRSLLKFGLGASLFLGTASLVACSADTPASGYQTIRSSDLPALRALLASIVPGAASEPALRQLDHNLGALSPAMLGLTRQLFDVLSLPLTRGPLTGIWGAWENAEPAQVQRFLQRWEHSALDMLRQGHAALLQLTLMAWYETPASWATCGYPGPPKI
ncbi:twin-arginine translocation pathway signal protein [Pseudomonas sp. SDI]|uniref:twin-arginine translocation pathway signal protein n=1 Tax=Pseudomonas sp. SDI TaxID=2170734 RepID=UPI000DE655B3|nr:twin-arginine translocation pathway signal protein [Pseudomonas sp. SDI]PWB31775.1 twin-arginine translocation pathway signal protein [Pseudomonas sp. SDI]